MSDLDLLDSDVEDELRASVRNLLTDRCPPSAVLPLYEGDRSLISPLWKALATDLGLAGLLVPEERGGAGASAREAAVVLEELGRAVAAVPFLTSAIVATSALLAVPGSAALDIALARLAGAEATGTLALPLSTAPGAAWPSSAAVDGDRLTGRVTSVADGELADIAVVPALRGDVPVLALAESFEVTPRPSLDQTRRLADLTFDGAPVTVVAEGAEALAGLRAALLAGAGLLASEQLGVASWCLDETVAYVKGRTQFGRPVGSFQALKHRLADVWLEVTSLRAAARYAADRLARASATDPETELAVAVAQAYASNVAVHAAE